MHRACHLPPATCRRRGMAASMQLATIHPKHQTLERRVSSQHCGNLQAPSAGHDSPLRATAVPGTCLAGTPVPPGRARPTAPSPTCYHYMSSGGAACHALHCTAAALRWPTVRPNAAPGLPRPARWLDARQQWGLLVNTARTFVRQAMTTLPEDR